MNVKIQGMNMNAFLGIFLLLMHTDEWNNFLQRVKCSSEEELKGNESDELEEELRRWASYRGQTLTRTGSLFLSLSHRHKHSHILTHCCTTMSFPQNDIAFN